MERKMRLLVIHIMAIVVCQGSSILDRGEILDCKKDSVFCSDVFRDIRRATIENGKLEREKYIVPGKNFAFIRNITSREKRLDKDMIVAEDDLSGVTRGEFYVCFYRDMVEDGRKVKIHSVRSKIALRNRKSICIFPYSMHEHKSIEEAATKIDAYIKREEGAYTLKQAIFYIQECIGLLMYRFIIENDKARDLIRTKIDQGVERNMEDLFYLIKYKLRKLKLMLKFLETLNIKDTCCCMLKHSLQNLVSKTCQF